MRLFIAAELPEEIEDALLDNLAELRDLVPGKSVRPDSLHICRYGVGSQRCAQGAGGV